MNTTILTSEQEIEMNMYGCTLDDLRSDVEDSIYTKFSQVDVLVMSMLSDAQEMVAYNAPSAATLNKQRQLINCAKWVMRKYVMEANRSGS